MCGSRGGQGSGPPPPLKYHKNIGFSSNTGPDPLKNRSYQASIQCWAIIGTPAKRHLMAFRWRADDGPLIVVLGSSLPSSTKKKVVKVGPPLTTFSGSAHEPYPDNVVCLSCLSPLRISKALQNTFYNGSHISDCSLVLVYMRGSRKFCQRGPTFDNVF